MTQYKDSGIEWIGEIPVGWEIDKIKYSSTLHGRIGWQGLTSEEYTEEGPYLITGTDFLNGRIDWNSCVHITEERWTEADKIQITNGDLLITKDGTVGKTAIVENLLGKASLNSGVLLIKLFNQSKKYLYWLLNSKVFWEWFDITNSGNSTILHLYQKDFDNFTYPVPSLQEQAAIATFLDKKTAEIDAIMDKITQQIQTLKDYRQSLITETVTKGLDKNVELKDSGIEWIGEIPVGWEVSRMQQIADYKKGPFGSALTLDMFVEKNTNTYKVYEQKNAIQGDYSLGEYYIDEATFSQLKGFAIKPMDIIVSCAGTIGKCYILPETCEPGIINQALMRVTLHNGVNMLYFLYLFDLELDYANKKFSNGSAIKNIPPFNILKKLSLPLPPLQEQAAIADYLDKKTTQIDRIITKKEEQLAIMKEHRKSLIYEYVTGKKRLKEFDEDGN